MSWDVIAKSPDWPRGEEHGHFSINIMRLVERCFCARVGARARWGPMGKACSDETKSSEHAAGFSRAAAGVKPRSFEVAPRKSWGFQARKRGPVLREAPSVHWLMANPTRA